MEAGFTRVWRRSSLIFDPLAVQSRDVSALPFNSWPKNSARSGAEGQRDVRPISTD